MVDRSTTTSDMQSVLAVLPSMPAASAAASREELTERLQLLERAANQLESDNRDLAARLREALNQNELLQSAHKHDVQRLKGKSGSQ